MKCWRDLTDRALNCGSLGIIYSSALDCSVVIYTNEHIATYSIGKAAYLFRYIAYFLRHGNLEIHIVRFSTFCHPLYVFCCNHNINAY